MPKPLSRALVLHGSLDLVNERLVPIGGDLPEHHAAQAVLQHEVQFQAQRLGILIGDEVPPMSSRVVGVGRLGDGIPIARLAAIRQHRFDLEEVVDACGTA